MTARTQILSIIILTVFTFSASGEQSFPQDVQHVLDNAEMCQHLAGEWGSSLPEKDKSDIEKGVDTYCPPAKKALPDLREKYKGNSEITKILSEYVF